MTFDEWIVKVCRNRKPLNQPFDDWFVCMQETWKEGIKQGYSIAFEEGRQYVINNGYVPPDKEKREDTC